FAVPSADRRVRKLIRKRLGPVFLRRGCAKGKDLPMRRFILAVLVVAALVHPAGAADDPEERARAVAREHFAQGTTFFDLGPYDEAIVEYEAAYQAKNDPAFLYNLAQAHRLARPAATALRVYQAYLARWPNAVN